MLWEVGNAEAVAMLVIDESAKMIEMASGTDLKIDSIMVSEYCCKVKRDEDRRWFRSTVLKGLYNYILRIIF